MLNLRFVRYATAAILVAVLGLVASTAEATTIYDFNQVECLQPSTTTPNATSSDFQIDSPLAAFCSPFGGGLGNFSAQFSVAANAGYALDVTGFSFDEANPTRNGPTRFDVFTSADGFTSPILSGSLAPNTPFTNHAVSLALSGLTDPLIVRIVASGHNGGMSVGMWFFDNVTLIATTVPLAAPVPEPTSMILLGTGLLGAVGLRRRLRG